MQAHTSKGIYKGILLAVIACIIWSGNFIAARGVANSISPVALSFFRWCTASLVILPFAWRNLRKEITIAFDNKIFFLVAAATGISMFNTFVYIAAHFSPAINLALIGTTASPVFAIILARIILKENITWLRVAGLSICMAGILFLLGKGNMQQILSLQFSTGDLWILAAALTFAIYNTLVKKRPAGISGIGFLSITFSFGTIILLPFFITEQVVYTPVQLTTNLLLVILYLGIGASVIAFMCWNAAIARLGAARTALFGNLIPIFSSMEAAWLLSESVTIVHVISFILVAAGLVIANISKRK